MVLFQLDERAFERELAARDLQALDKIAGAGEQHAPSALDEAEADGGGKMALAAAGRTSVVMPGVWRLKCVPALRSFSPRSAKAVLVLWCRSKRHGWLGMVATGTRCSSSAVLLERSSR